MRTLQRRDNPLEARQLVGRTERFVVVDGKDSGAVARGQVGVQRTDARIIETRRDGVGLLDLSVFVLHHQRPRAVDDALLPEVDSRRALSREDTFTTRFREHNLHPLVVQVVIDSTGGIASASDAGKEVVGVVAAFLFRQLLLDFLTDNRLQAGDHVGIRVRAHRRADDVIRIRRMTAPVADSFVCRVLERHVAGGNGDDPRAEHLHLLDVGVLPLNVCFTHIDHALHVHQGADRGGGDAVLSGTRLRDDAAFAHLTGDENLADGVVDFVSAGMVEVFALEVDFATVLPAEASGQIERRGAADVIAQELVVFLAERLAVHHLQVSLPQLLHAAVKDFRDVSPAEFSVITFVVYLVHSLYCRLKLFILLSCDKKKSGLPQVRQTALDIFDSYKYTQ